MHQIGERTKFQSYHAKLTKPVERLWKSVKYEEVSRHAYDSVSEAKCGLEQYFMTTSRDHIRRLTTKRRRSSLATTGLCCQKSRRQETERLHVRNGKFCPNNRSHFSLKTNSKIFTYKLNSRSGGIITEIFSLCRPHILGGTTGLNVKAFYRKKADIPRI